jgi:hypothetical protein
MKQCVCFTMHQKPIYLLTYYDPGTVRSFNVTYTMCIVLMLPKNFMSHLDRMTL